MRTLTLKNIPDNLYEQLRTRAKSNGREISEEIIDSLASNLKVKRVDHESLLMRITHLQNRLTMPHLTDELLLQAKEEGRL